MVNQGINRLIQRPEQNPKANVVDTSIRRRDESVLGVVLGRLDGDNLPRGKLQHILHPIATSNKPQHLLSPVINCHNVGLGVAVPVEVNPGMLLQQGKGSQFIRSRLTSAFTCVSFLGRLWVSGLSKPRLFAHIAKEPLKDSRQNIVAIPWNYLGFATAGLYRLGVVIHHQIMGRHQLALVCPISIAIGLLEGSPHNRNLQQQPVVLLFPGFVLFEQLIAHVFGHALCPSLELPVGIFPYDTALYEVSPLHEGRVGA